MGKRQDAVGQSVPSLPFLEVHLVCPNGVRNELRVPGPSNEFPLLLLLFRLPGIKFEQHELLETGKAVELALSLPVQQRGAR